jgi:hypothetical protein
LVSIDFIAKGSIFFAPLSPCSPATSRTLLFALIVVTKTLIGPRYGREFLTAAFTEHLIGIFDLHLCSVTGGGSLTVRLFLAFIAD